MTKIKKQRKRKVYRHGVNRKRLRNKQNKVPEVKCDQLKNEWENGKSVSTNLSEMGLASDPNKALSIPNTKTLLQPHVTTETSEERKEQAKKQHVAIDLETNAKLPRAHVFRMPSNQVQWLTYLLDRYGDDYKAMSRDPKNYYQETSKQIRAKIKKFQSIPEQFQEYIKSSTKTKQATSNGSSG